MTTDTTLLPAADGSTGGRRPEPGPRTAVQVLAVLLSLLLVGWCALTVASLLARGSGQAHGTFTGVRTLALDTGFESVDVAGSAAGTTVTMQRSYHWSLGRPTVRARQDGDVLRISSSCPFQVGIGCTGKVHLVVPAGVQVRADTRDGHLTLRDLTGTVTASTSDGGIDADDLTGRLALTTRDGSVDARGLRSTSVSAQSSDGDVRLSFATAPSAVTGRSRDGSLVVLVPPDGTAYDVSTAVRDGSRKVSVPTDPQSAHRITLTASDGSVVVVHNNP